VSELQTEQLVADFLAGKQTAAAHLLERYSRVAYAAITNLLYRHADRDDVYQEACLRAFNSLKSLDNPTAFGGWFKQIAIRTAIDHIRRQKFRFEALNEQLPDPSPGPEISVLESALRRQVRQAVDQLPEHYRQVIVLFYWSDCSYQEIAAALGVPLGTVMSRLHKAKGLLARALGDQSPQLKEGVERWI